MPDHTEHSEETVGISAPSPEEDFITKEDEAEEVYLLRRELSLLKKTHREVCVAYYVDNKSCSQIAKEQNISVEMVKYHLFKTRKLLKEGIGMKRTLGEKFHGGDIGYHIRGGCHYFSREDWKRYVEFLEK